MNYLKSAWALAALSLAAPTVQAQLVQDPTAWTYETKKKTGNEYELIFHLKLQSGWHIWSLKPGGDGYQLPPTFTFDPAAGVKLLGSPTEKGKPIVVTMDGIDGKVTYYSGQVDYIQAVQVTKKGRITGKHEYQVCNDQMCLPPKKKTFEFVVQ